MRLNKLYMSTGCFSVALVLLRNGPYTFANVVFQHIFVSYTHRTWAFTLDKTGCYYFGTFLSPNTERKLTTLSKPQFPFV